jgi:hypothetical protein
MPAECGIAHYRVSVTPESPLEFRIEAFLPLRPRPGRVSESPLAEHLGHDGLLRTEACDERSAMNVAAVASLLAAALMRAAAIRVLVLLRPMIASHRQPKGNTTPRWIAIIIPALPISGIRSSTTAKMARDRRSIWA